MPLVSVVIIISDCHYPNYLNICEINMRSRALENRLLNQTSSDDGDNIAYLEGVRQGEVL